MSRAARSAVCACGAGAAGVEGFAGVVFNGRASSPRASSVPSLWCGVVAARAVRASVRCIGPYPAVTLGRPRFASQRDSRYDTPSSTLSGTPDAVDAALNASWRDDARSSPTMTWPAGAA